MLADAYGQLNGMDQQNQDAATRTFAAIAHDTLQSVAEITAENRSHKETEAETKFSIKRDVQNRPFVEIDRDILQGVPQTEWIKTVKENLRSRFPNGVTIGRENIAINAQSRRELTWSNDTRSLYKKEYTTFADKLRATDNVDEILQVTSNWIGEGLNHPRKDKITEFARGQALIRIGGNGYSSDVIVATREDGSLVLYDIIKMMPEQITEKYSRYTDNVQNEPLRSRTVFSTNNMPQKADFVNRENQENADRTTFSMEEDDLNSAETYTYEHLTAQPDMNVVQIADLSNLSENGKIDRNQVRAAGLENSKAIRSGRFGNYDSVQNAYTGNDLLIAGSSIRHGLSGSFVRLSINSKLGAVVGSLAQNAIPINALQPTNSNVEQTYAMAGVGTDGVNDYLGIIHVNRQTSAVDKVELLDYVHSINGRVRKNNSFDAKSTHYATDTAVPGTVVSKISIADVLELVKDLHPDVYYTIPRTVRELQLTVGVRSL